MPKTTNISFSFKEFGNKDELSYGDRELINIAIETANNAYAPYSGFRVGAAIRLKSGMIVKGANVENAAFPSGICAERNALSNSVSNHPDDHPVAIAIAALSGDEQTELPVTPCGNCRQVLAEEESRHGNEIKVILSGKAKTYIINSIGELLPLQFNNENLKTILPL